MRKPVSEAVAPKDMMQVPKSSFCRPTKGREARDGLSADPPQEGRRRLGR